MTNPSLHDLPLAAEAVQAILRGEPLQEPLNYEDFGEYHDLIWRLNLLAAIDVEKAQELWHLESVTVPKLEAMVEGMSQEGLVHVSDLYATMKEWYDHGSPQGVSPGWTTLAQVYRVLPGELTLITGTPSAGKSRVLSAMAINIAKREDWKFTVFSPEMAPPQRHLRLMLTQYVGKSFDRKTDRMTWAEAEEGMQWLNRHFTWLWPKTQPATVAYLLHMAKIQVLTTGVKGVIIDPWNRVIHVRGEKSLETEYIGQCLADISRFAQTYGVHVWLVAHPTKVFHEGGKFPIITPNLIAGSAHWWNMADNILSVWRDLDNDDDQTVTIHTQKIRWDENGQMGRMVELYYHPETGRYSELYATPYQSNGHGRHQ